MASIIPKGIPFSQLPNEAITDTTLTAAAFRVLADLHRRANSEARAWPSQRTIAKDIGINKSTVAAAIDQLQTAGWLTVHVEDDQQVTGHKQRHSYIVYGMRPAQLFEADRTDKPTVRINQPVGSETETVWIEDGNRTENGDITTSIEPHPSELQIAPTEKVKERPRNLWWDELVALFGEPTTETRQRLYGRITALVSDQPVSEIRRRAAWIVENWGHEKLTPTSLETHWSRFDAAIGQVNDADVDAFTEAQGRAAMLERLADE